jgi:hypothetical protein
MQEESKVLLTRKSIYEILYGGLVVSCSLSLLNWKRAVLQRELFKAESIDASTYARSDHK